MFASILDGRHSRVPSRLEKRPEPKTRSTAAVENPDELMAFGGKTAPRWLVQSVLRAAHAAGVDPVYLMTLADAGSSLSPGAKAPTSSAWRVCSSSSTGPGSRPCTPMRPNTASGPSPTRSPWWTAIRSYRRTRPAPGYACGGTPILGPDGPSSSSATSSASFNPTASASLAEIRTLYRAFPRSRECGEVSARARRGAECPGLEAVPEGGSSPISACLPR